MRILGVDPGKSLGWFLWDSEADAEIAGGEIEYRNPDADERVESIKIDWTARLKRLAPDLVGVEQMRSFGNRADRSLHSVASALKLVCKRAGIPVVEVNILTNKKLFTGSGKAGKVEMQMAAKLRFGRLFTSEEADAAGVATSALDVWQEKVAAEREKAAAKAAKVRVKRVNIRR